MPEMCSMTNKCAIKAKFVITDLDWHHIHVPSAVEYAVEIYMYEVLILSWVYSSSMHYAINRMFH